MGLKNLTKKKFFKKLIFLPLFLILTSLAFLTGWFLKEKSLKTPPQPDEPQIAFLKEVWQVINDNYWEKIEEEKLVELFLAAAERLTGSPQERKNLNQEVLFKTLKKLLKSVPSEKQNEFATQLADLVLANLQPLGRSRLYTQKEEKSLAEAIHNVTTEDFYKVLDVPKEASLKEINKAFEEKKKVFEKEAPSSPTAAAELKRVKKAFQTLSEKESRQLYDQAGIEPTIDYALVDPDILYLHLKKISPTSLDELARVTQKFDKDDGPTSLILDLKDNIGGSLDILPYLLGPFIGPDSEAFRLYHQGEKQIFRTQTSWLPSLVRYKKVVVIVNENTQSSAEAMAAALKKYNVGVVIGKPTKGWGTVERVFPLTQKLDQNNKYSVFLIHSLVLGDEGEPIEGRGVQPLINIQNPGWEKELEKYFNYPPLIKAVKEKLSSF